MGAFRDITARSFKSRDSRINFPNKKRDNVDWGFVIAEMTRDFVKQAASLSGQILGNMAERDKQLSDRTTDFLTSDTMAKQPLD